MGNAQMAFKKEYRGFVATAFYTDGPDAHVDITRDGQPFRSFDYPAYRIWNIAAHLPELVDDLLAADVDAAADDADREMGIERF